jgi:hypothetical protein
MALHTSRRDILVPPCRLRGQKGTPFGGTSAATQKTSRLIPARTLPLEIPLLNRSLQHPYFVVTIQSGAIDWPNGEFVIRPNVPLEELIPKAEMLEDPKLAT